MIIKKLYPILLTSVLLLAGCNKQEGEGGTAVIQGKIYTVLHNVGDYSMTLDTIVAAKQDVFIVYGDESYYGDDAETADDGTYQFKYLTPGDYTIYAYSELASGELVAVKKEVTLKRGETLTVEDIYIHDGKTNGTSMIRGQVWCTWFDKDGDDISSSWAYDQRVYIQRLNDDYYLDDTRVGLNGMYYFQKLTPDTYVIYTFSQTDDEVPYPVYDTVTVSTTDTVYDAGMISIRLKA